jgi:hypothetical protein
VLSPGFLAAGPKLRKWYGQGERFPKDGVPEKDQVRVLLSVLAMQVLQRDPPACFSLQPDACPVSI